MAEARRFNMQANPRRRLSVVAACALIAGAGVLAAGQAPAQAAKPATAAQKRAMAKAVPAAVTFAGWPRAMRRCYTLDRSRAKRSTVNRTYRFGLVRYNERPSGPCSEPDASHSFYVYWQATRSGLRPRWYTNQFGCSRRSKVPLAVQREMLPGCPVY